VLRLLLDEHLSPDIVPAIRAIRPDIVAISLYRWEDGRYVGGADSLIVARAYEEGLTLVTYDLKTIPRLLVRLAERGNSHAGVVFGDNRTILPNDISGVARALVRLCQEQGDVDWTDCVAYLERAPE